MASTSSRPVTRSKPRGANVRAFIETVEQGSKPQPDFFNSNAKKKVAINALTKETGSNVKPPILTKKPTIKHGSRRSPAVVIVSSCCREPATLPPVGETTPYCDEEETVSSDINCPSEDSGHSTCELKYSGMYWCD